MAKWRLSRIYLNKSGYTNGQNGQRPGTYYGVGAPLYSALCEDHTVKQETEVFRAKDREAAKAYIKSSFDPDATFYKG